MGLNWLGIMVTIPQRTTDVPAASTAGDAADGGIPCRVIPREVFPHVGARTGLLDLSQLRQIL